MRGKLPQITQACGNRRFTRSERFKRWGGRKVQDGPLRPSGAILEAEKGYSARRRGLGTAFHPAGRVPEPEAFLARRIGRGYLLSLVEEDPALRKLGPAGEGSRDFPVCVHDVGCRLFSHRTWPSSPPPKQRRLVALHSWGFLRAIGPAVAARPPARSPVLRDAGSGGPEPWRSSGPAKRP